MDDAVADEPHRAERRTRAVAAITAITMVAEIGAGWWFNSMALLADGWHMGTHAAAIGLASLAYALVRRWRDDARFAFGPWKVEVLAAFASAVALLVAALGIASSSIERLVAPQPIHYREAIVVAAIGLAVNLVCAWLLGGDHGHDHDHHGHGHRGHEHDHEHHDRDHQGREHHDRDHQGHGHDHHAPHADVNLRSAYLHVLADAATSALAIVALAGGLWFGLASLDPLMGVVGALLVGRWGVLLMRDTGRTLLDGEMDDPLPRAVRHALSTDTPWAGSADVAAFGMWRVGRNDWACALRLTTRDPVLDARRVRGWLARWPQLRQATIEIERH